MRIPRLFIDDNLTTGSLITLDKARSSYLLRVLRLQATDSLIVFNGQGGQYRASITETGKQAHIEILKHEEQECESPLKIILQQGISKGDHMDMVIQKSVELGVTVLQPIISERTVVNLKQDRMDKKLNHWNGIIQSASEQCGRNILMQIDTPVKYQQAIQNSCANKLILSPYSTANLNTLKVNENSAMSLLIGPEGGFSDEEIKLAESEGYQSIKLGPRVLRTETAAISAVTILQSHFGDLLS